MASAFERDVKYLIDVLKDHVPVVKPITKEKFQELTGLSDNEIKNLNRYGPADIVLRPAGVKGQKIMYSYENFCKSYQPA